MIRISNGAAADNAAQRPGRGTRGNTRKPAAAEQRREKQRRSR